MAAAVTPALPQAAVPARPGRAPGGAGPSADGVAAALRARAGEREAGAAAPGETPDDDAPTGAGATTDSPAGDTPPIGAAAADGTDPAAAQPVPVPPVAAEAGAAAVAVASLPAPVTPADAGAPSTPGVTVTGAPTGSGAASAASAPAAPPAATAAAQGSVPVPDPTATGPTGTTGPTGPAGTTGPAGPTAADRLPTTGATSTSTPPRAAVTGPDGAIATGPAVPQPLPAGAAPTSDADPGLVTPPVASPAVTPTTAAAPVAPPAPPTAPAAPAPLPHTQVLTAVTPLLTGPDGTHEVTIRLDPEGLGAVHVRLSVSGDEVRMHLTAAESATRDALRDGLAELRTRLEDSGLRATRLDVGTGDTPRHHGSGTPDPHRPRSADRPAAHHGPAPPEPTAAPTRAHRPDTRLDLRM